MRVTHLVYAPARPGPGHRRLRRGQRAGLVPVRLAVDHRRHHQLREARRRARHLAGIALQLADPHLLVRAAVGGLSWAWCRCRWSVILVGIGTWIAGLFLLGVWAIYRIARGWMRLNATSRCR
ncbi:MAG: hypothetical protein MZW92_56055 [Comamonadaceae bacterium]|nr:hypothetical protein [Comamonadaceae bacterium]